MPSPDELERQAREQPRPKIIEELLRQATPEELVEQRANYSVGQRGPRNTTDIVNRVIDARDP